jgi:hypothetical protein
MTRLRDLHQRWLKDPEYREEYERLGPEFELARALIEARSRAGLTQAQLADRMRTTQSVIARLESGRGRNPRTPRPRDGQSPEDHLRARCCGCFLPAQSGRCAGTSILR